MITLITRCFDLGDELATLSPIYNDIYLNIKQLQTMNFIHQGGNEAHPYVLLVG